MDEWDRDQTQSVLYFLKCSTNLLEISHILTIRTEKCLHVAWKYIFLFKVGLMFCSNYKLHY